MPRNPTPEKSKDDPCGDLRPVHYWKWIRADGRTASPCSYPRPLAKRCRITNYNLAAVTCAKCLAWLDSHPQEQKKELADAGA